MTLDRPLRVQVRSLRRALHLGDRIERLVVDLDPGRGPARLFGVGGRDERDRLAEVADAVEREDGLIADLEPVGLRARDIGVGEDGVDPGRRECRGDVDRADRRVGKRASQRVPEEHAGRAQVARVGELALDLRRRVGPREPRADPTQLESSEPRLVVTAAHRPGHATARARRRRAGSWLVTRAGNGGQANRGEDLLVAGAAAEVAGERLADLVVARVRRSREEVGGGDDESGGAEAALDRSRFDEGRLDGVEPGAVGEPLDRRHLVTVGLRREDEAGADEGAVEQHRARAALPLLARVLRPRVAELLAQREEQRLPLPAVGDGREPR